jgi:hypothetical protein
VALANEPDLRVVATPALDAIPGPTLGNARLAQYLPFEWMLPKVDVFVTNGGYGKPIEKGKEHILFHFKNLLKTDSHLNSPPFCLPVERLRKRLGIRGDPGD